MDLNKSINRVRKRLMMALTRNIGSSGNNQDISNIKRDEIKRVLITRPNHRLGNQLLVTPLVQEVINTFPGCKIDLFVKGYVATIIFKNYDNIDTIIQLPKQHFKKIFQYLNGWMALRKNRYDLVISASRTSSSGRLSTKFARARYRFFGDDENNPQSKNADYRHLAKNPIYGFRNFISKSGITVAESGFPSMDIKLSSDEIAQGEKILNNLVERKEKTICLFTYATGAKCYTEEWWSELYDALKVKYPHYGFMEILPVENISKIAFREPSFYSKDIREMAAVMANCDVFVGADSGIMHLASSANIPTIGLFSITNPENYAPYNNKSKGLNTNVLTIDDIIREVDYALA
jgi:heptosyltransferase III